MAAITSTIPQAVAFITGPLAAVYTREKDIAKLTKLASALYTTLFDAYVSSWNVADPSSGSGRRCLTLGPHGAPRPVHKAFEASGISWDHWVAAVGSVEIDLFVDPGRVAYRCSTTGASVTYWTADAAARRAEAIRAKSLEDELRERDRAEADELFSAIDDELRAPWFSPMLTAFPAVPTSSASRPRAPSPALSFTSTHSRASSFSSVSSASGASLSSVDTDSTSATSSPTSSPSLIRRDRSPRLSRVFIDREKREVTPYDGGKTTVLTGGVMLGGKPSAHRRSPSTATPVPAASTPAWRPTRA